MNYFLFALEGISYSGKTTLSKNLAEMGVSRMPELAEFYSNGAEFPTFPRNDEEAKISDKWFFEKECERMNITKEMLRNGPVVQDRSYISSQAFVYARNKVFGVGDPEYNKQLINESLEKDIIIKPNIIYLRISLEEFRYRKSVDLKRRISDFGLLAVKNTTYPKEENLMYSQIEFYELLTSLESVIIIDAQKSKQEICREVYSCIKEWKI